MPSAVGYRQLIIGNRNFRNLWAGQIVSMFGDWFNLIACAALVGTLSSYGLVIGSLFIVRMAAPLFVSSIGGVLADRHSRRLIMVATDLLRAVVVLGFLLVRSPSELWLMFGLTALQFALSGLFVPAQSAILPDIVSDSELGTANALSSATYAVMQALGAAVGGISTGLWGVHVTFLVDAFSFVVSAMLCWRITLTTVTHRTRVVSQRWHVEFLDGLSYLRAHRDTMLVVLHKGANCLLITGGLNVLLVLLAEQTFVIGRDGGISVGLLFGATGVGTALGPLIARVFTGDRESSLRQGLALSYLVSGMGLALMASLHSFVLVFAGTALRGMGGGMLFVFSTQLLLMRVPNAVRGRVFSTEFALRSAMSALGMALVSALVGSVFGLSTMLWLMSVLTLIPAALWCWWLIASRPAHAFNDAMSSA